jgi:hypothetical protein
MTKGETNEPQQVYGGTLTNPIIVWAGDLHINSTVALCVPEFKRDDGDFHKNSRLQNELWTAWGDAWKQVKAKARGREVVTIIGGEIADEMMKHPTYQYITHNTDDIRRMAIETLEPLPKVTDKLIVLRGTEAHSGLSANLDEGIAREIAKQYDGIKVIKDGTRFSHWYARMYIGGRLFDLAHHVSMGQSKRTERDAANHLSADLMMIYGRQGKKFPDFALRGHVHRVSDSGMNFPIRSIICPTWQMTTTHTHRIGGGMDVPEIGLVVIEPDTKNTEWIRYEAKSKEPQFV